MMREPTPSRPSHLTDQQTLHDTMIVGQQHISLNANGYRCQTDDLWRILLAAAARHTTIEAACADLERAPDATTVRGHLTQQLLEVSIPDLEHQRSFPCCHLASPPSRDEEQPGCPDEMGPIR